MAGWLICERVNRCIGKLPAKSRLFSIPGRNLGGANGSMAKHFKPSVSLLPMVAKPQHMLFMSDERHVSTRYGIV